jgi:hypothetical protein
MSSSILIGILLIFAIGVFFIFKKSTPHKLKHTYVEDPEAQAAYDAKNTKKDETLALSLEERIELSWEFLNKITQQVIDLFSPQDKEQALEAGRKLAKHGAKYQHNVYQEAFGIKKSPKTQGVQQNKGAEVSR